MLQEPAAVAREVEQEAVGLLLLHLAQQPGHVVGALPLGRVRVSVEGGELQDRELVGLVVDLVLLEVQLRRLLGEVDLGPHDLDVELLGLLALAQDREAHLRARLAADQAYRVAQGHVDDVDEILAFLGHPDDLVLGPQHVVPVCCSAGDDPLGHRVAVLLGKRHADAFERERHADPEVLQNPGREIVGVRVQRRGEGVEERGVGLFRSGVHEAPQAPLVAPDELLLGLREFGVVAHIVGHLEVNQTAQQVVARLVVLRVAAHLRVEDQGRRGVDLVGFRADEVAHELGGSLVFEHEPLVQGGEQGAAAGIHLLEYPA